MKFNKTIISFLGVAILLVVAVVFFYYNQDNSAPSKSNLPETKQNNKEPQVQLETLAPSAQKEANIKVGEPISNAEVGLPLIIKGQARVFEATVNWRLRDEDGTLLVENFTDAMSLDIGEFGAFEVSSSYPEPNGAKGTIEVFWYSPVDGSEQDKITIPVVFKEIEVTNLKIFFSDRQKDPGTLNCDIVYSVNRRVPKTTGVAKAALEELLAGPTINEGDKSIFTSINSGTKVKSLKIQNGTAFADFDELLGLNVSGSCRVIAIRAQIEQTLRQFSTINNVVISINGKSKDILQP